MVVDTAPAALRDGHRFDRKAMFMSLMTTSSLSHLVDCVSRAWRGAIQRWAAAGHVVLFDELQHLLGRATCSWAGIPLPERQLPRRTRDLAAMVDVVGDGGWPPWREKLARVRSEWWMTHIVNKARKGKLPLSLQAPLYVVTHHRDRRGRLLDARTAAVELLDLVRPSVAIAWSVAFAALALHQHPGARQRLESTPTDEVRDRTGLFMREVRSLYPFVSLPLPSLADRVRAPFDWPGEWITLHHMTLALHFLVKGMHYDVPEQDLSFDLGRLPARPRSGFVIRNVRVGADFD